MAQIAVEVEAVRELAVRLAQVGSELCRAGGALPVEPLDGLPGLAAAADELCGAWRRALERTARAADEAGRHLQAAAGSYAEVDAAVAQACG